MVQKVTYIGVLNTVRERINNCALPFDIITDNEHYIRAICNSRNYIAEFLVEQAFFAPYRFVKIEILTKSENYDIAHIWYDSETDGLDDIQQKVDEAITLLKEDI